jgi:hypothetical protein
MKEWLGNETTNQAQTIFGGWLGQEHSQGVNNMLVCKCTRKNE